MALDSFGDKIRVLCPNVLVRLPFMKRLVLGCRLQPAMTSTSAISPTNGLATRQMGINDKPWTLFVGFVAPNAIGRASQYLNFCFEARLSFT
jgi:hypothetical protein